jgi:hypothetical protein
LLILSILANISHKKEPHSVIAMRPKRVGYWKASEIIVPRCPIFVNRSFWRKGTIFAEREQGCGTACDSFTRKRMEQRKIFYKSTLFG